MYSICIQIFVQNHTKKYFSFFEFLDRYEKIIFFIKINVRKSISKILLSYKNLYTKNSSLSFVYLVGIFLYNFTASWSGCHSHLSVSDSPYKSHDLIVAIRDKIWFQSRRIETYKNLSWNIGRFFLLWFLFFIFGIVAKLFSFLSFLRGLNMVFLSYSPLWNW